MADTSAPAAPAEPSNAAPAAEGAPAESKPVDPWAELDAGILKAGVKLKAKDREVPVTSMKDLVARANRVFGVEQMVEETKAQRGQAEEVLKLRAAIEGDDEEAALEALQRLGGPRAAQRAMELTRRRYLKEQEEAQLSENERHYKAAAEQQAQELRTYKQREAAQKQLQERVATEQMHERVRGEALGVAQQVLTKMGVDPKASPHVAASQVYRVARHLRAADAEGRSADVAEIEANVRDEIAQETQPIIRGMSPEALYEFLGDEGVKRILREQLRRNRGGQPTAQQAQAATGQPAQANGAAPASPLRGLPGFFK